METLVKEEMEVLTMMWARWLRSDFNWALEQIMVKGGPAVEGEWDYLRGEWIEKFMEWMFPYIKRLQEEEHLTEDEVGEFVTSAYALMEVTLDLIYKLEVKGVG